jgi:membrane fusion protein (multidrug efflux system)
MLRTRLLLVLLLVFFASCHFQMPDPPTPRVTVEEALVRDVPKYFYTTGETVAVKSVDIPARVIGILEKMLYKKGDVVPEGKPLFVIEQEQYKIAVKSAQAKLLDAQAKLALAESSLSKTMQLQKQNAVADQDVQKDTSERNQGLAAVQAAEADVAQAELNLKYTEVICPITGKTSVSEIAVGNLVGPGSGNPILTTIVSIDPMGVAFSVSDADFHRLLEEYLQREEKNQTEKEPEFELAFFKSTDPQSANYPFKGVIKATANVINKSTGTLTICGEVPNPRYEMLPGEICRIRILEGIQENTVLIHQKAVSIDLNQHFIFVIDENNIVRRRNVELGDLQSDNTRIVLYGLQKGERYIVRGIQNIRDGSRVIVVSDEKNQEDNVTVH